MMPAWSDRLYLLEQVDPGMVIYRKGFFRHVVGVCPTEEAWKIMELRNHPVSQ